MNNSHYYFIELHYFVVAGFKVPNCNKLDCEEIPVAELIL